jgi:predicted nucleotidyltransferase
MRGKAMATTSPKSRPGNQALQEVTRRIVHVAKPSRLLLFGSAATGRMTENSDLDILVIVPGPVHRRQMAQEIYRSLRGVGVPVDVVVATEEDLQKYGQRSGTILKPALQEGRIIYEA